MGRDKIFLRMPFLEMYEGWGLWRRCCGIPRGM